MSEKESKKRKSREESEESDSTSSSSESSGDERRRKKEKKAEKKEKKEKKERKKREKEEKKKDKKKSKKLKKKIEELSKLQAASGATLRPEGVPEISTSDYFDRSMEYRVWLLEEKKKYLDEISTDKAHKYFDKEFVPMWNLGILTEKYYRGIRSSEVDSSARTRFKWSFASRLDPHEIASVRDSVDTDTYEKRRLLEDELGREKRGAGAGGAPRGGGPSGGAGPRVRSDGKVVMRDDDENYFTKVRGPQGPPPPRRRDDESDAVDPFEAYQERKRQEKAEQLRWRKQQEASLEELAPKPDPGSFQARMEKRRAKAGPRGRGDSPDAEVDLGGGVGSGGDSEFQRRLAKERDRKERKAIQAMEKVLEYQEKERQKMADLLESMGLSNKFSAGVAKPFDISREYQERR